MFVAYHADLAPLPSCESSCPCQPWIFFSITDHTLGPGAGLHMGATAYFSADLGSWAVGGASLISVSDNHLP